MEQRDGAGERGLEIRLAGDGEVHRPEGLGGTVRVMAVILLRERERSGGESDPGEERKDFSVDHDWTSPES